jgi:hypothetical protein
LQNGQFVRSIADISRVSAQPQALDLPGPSRRITVEPVRLPVPQRAPEAPPAEPEPPPSEAPPPQPEPEPIEAPPADPEREAPDPERERRPVRA